MTGEDLIFKPHSIRACTFRNPIWIPPMCQYVAPDGVPTTWHLTHYSALATSTGAVIVEATAISQEARVAPEDLVLESEHQLPAFRALVDCIASRGAVPGIQLSHAGRKASRSRPWDGDLPIPIAEGGWRLLAPSPLAFGAEYELPTEMTPEDIEGVLRDFERSAELAVEAGFKVIEVHAAHGRLIHSFLSSVSNQRTDNFGGSLVGRSTFARQVARRIRKVIGEELVLVFRLSCVDWCEGGLTIDDTVEIAELLKSDGVDMIDCSSGGIIKPLSKPTSPGYQVPFAREIRKRTGIATAAVGMIKTLDLAETILQQEDADVILLGRFLMMDPLALTRRAAERGLTDMIPEPYRRAVARAATADRADHIPEL
jgi:2,4-dienoyl-CoA reductase-like NADH-dependent reductase (Old Yellow Enzyme family)